MLPRLAYDYRTFFFTNIASVTVFTVCLSLLSGSTAACRNQVVCGRADCGLVQADSARFGRKVPTVLGGMLANELYLISFIMQLMGLRWFVVRKPMRSRWPLMAIGLCWWSIP